MNLEPRHARGATVKNMKGGRTLQTLVSASAKAQEGRGHGPVGTGGGRRLERRSRRKGMALRTGVPANVWRVPVAPPRASKASFLPKLPIPLNAAGLVALATMTQNQARPK